MKKYASILTAIAAVAALASCNKDLEPGRVDIGPDEGGLHTIAVSFDAPTKTTLTGSRPHFNVNDTILVSNDEESEVCTVELNGEKTVIRTKLSGPYKAVYPHTAALLDENNENRIIGIKVPAQQSGKFEDANICMANQKAHGKGQGTRAEALHFYNRVAILKFYVDRSIRVTSIKVTHNVGREIADGSSTIDVKCPKGCKQLYDAMPKDKQDPRICYVAIQPEDDEYSGTEANDLTFEVETDTHGNWTKTPTAGEGIIRNQMYNVFYPYHIDVQVGSEKQQWGYCNVGAFLPEEPGLFFAWGDVKGHRADFSREAEEDGDGFSIFDAFAEDFYFFDFSDERYKDNEIESEEGFHIKNAPYYSNETEAYTKYTGSDYETLKRSDDAASVNWGSKWRMPTKDEFTSLIEVTDTDVKSDIVGKCLQIRNTNLLFPAAGLGRGTKLQVYAKLDEEMYYLGNYWTNEPDSDNSDAYGLQFITGIRFEITDHMRQFGFSVRPIYDETLPENDPVALTNNPYTNGGTF